MTREQLIAYVLDARRRTLGLIADLTDGAMAVPRLPIVNPLLWEIGHIAWFQEKWILRVAGRLASMRPDADLLYDSAAVPHEVRWDLPLPDREETVRYLAQTRDRVVERLGRREPSPDDVYFTLLCVLHEDMHGEALTYTRQTLGYRAPRLDTILSQHDGSEQKSAGPALDAVPDAGSGPWHGDVSLPGGDFLLGAADDGPFVFDNEQQAHWVRIAPFTIARAPVTQQQFAAFVEDGGYGDERWWSAEGRRWRAADRAEHPVYWQRQAAGRWLRRDFDRWRPLEPHRPVVHVNRYEADAYCRWAGRRLPTEAEWEFAATTAPPTPGVPTAGAPGVLSKRAFPWGSLEPSPRHANLDGGELGCVDVAALPAGDSAWGCRQMIGNVWEWTASDFGPYPGFVAGPYKEYSAPWFGTHKVLRGGCWATRGRLIRPSYRNYFTPDRRDVFAGFRTCALAPS